jgi:hypothetical protein
LQKGGNISSALNFQGDVNLAVTVDESTGDDSSSLKDVSVNINDLALTSSADGLAIADGITVNGNTSIVSLNNGIAYTPHGSILSFTPNKVLKFSNSITKSYVTITTQAKATIYVYSSSSSATASRQLRIKDDNATLATADIGTSTEISEVIFTVDSAGTYYIGSVSSSIYIYYIAIVY